MGNLPACLVRAKRLRQRKQLRYFCSFLSSFSVLLFYKKGLSIGSEILHGVITNKKNKIWYGSEIRGPPSSPSTGELPENIPNIFSLPRHVLCCQWGAERRVKPVQTQEGGPPSAPAEFLNVFHFKIVPSIYHVPQFTN